MPDNFVNAGVLDLHCPRCEAGIMADAILEYIIYDKCGFEFPATEGL